MDFHAEFRKSIKLFPGLEGLIFVDPDGEAVLFEAPNMDPFDVQLAGARVPILQNNYPLMENEKTPKVVELQFRRRYVLSIRLNQEYSITAIGRSIKERSAIKFHLTTLAKSFNKEII